MRSVRNMIIIFCLLFFSLTLGATTSSTSGKLYVFFNTENFIGVELRADVNPYSHIFGNVGLNYISAGFRLSSSQTRGLYIAPMIYYPYNNELNFALVAGYELRVENLKNLYFSFEGGAKRLNNKPEAFVNFGVNFLF
ncbi:MAG: hypothetical protein ACUVQF_06860 [Fervidobacterium sp.]|uniref:hypothetical protein n=1 Tax=Fervidobacterium sp. TaxID=1871331 RepID=UPI00404B9BE5